MSVLGGGGGSYERGTPVRLSDQGNRAFNNAGHHTATRGVQFNLIQLHLKHIPLPPWTPNVNTSELPLQLLEPKSESNPGTEHGLMPRLECSGKLFGRRVPNYKRGNVPFQRKCVFAAPRG